MRSTVETRVGIFVLVAIAIFLYMGFEIGAFRFDRSRYNPYFLYFSDVSGLSRKAEVRIAGVKVGWVESIELVPNTENKAKIKAMVLHDYFLYQNAHGIVRQDGLLGPKYIELIPGDPLLHRIDPGDTLKKPSIESVAIDDLMLRFKDIASNIQEITDSFKDAFGGPAGKENIRQLVDNMTVTAERLATFSDVISRTVVRNEQKIDSLLGIGDTVNNLAQRLDNEVFPSFQNSIEKISSVFDRDFDRIANQLGATAEAVESASVQAREGLKSISSVAGKLDEGRGVLGKLINDDDTYKDIKAAVRGLKDYIAKADRIEIVFDSHVETMHRPAEHLSFADSVRFFEDSKGYIDMRIHTGQDYFYVLQIVNSEKGSISRKETRKLYRDADNRPIDVSQLFISSTAPLENASALSVDLNTFFTEQTATIQRNSLKLGIQFGKIFNAIALRFGLIEGSAGGGIDVEIPLRSDNFRWVSTFEAFDFIGWNRIDDRRPHVKWLNKMFFMRNLYFTFGADDFISKENASAFFGFGLRFGDDDIKYLMPNLSGLGSSLSSFN